MVQEWSNKKAKDFATMADIVIPDRRRQFEIVCELVPFGRDTGFKFIDIGCGEGFLTKAILDCFPNAVAFASDVADEMLSKAEELLDDYGSRIHLSRYNIHEAAYLDSIVPGQVGFVTSSLAIHHCDDGEKARLYKAAFEKLTAPGAFIIIDVVKPASRYGAQLNKKHWQNSIRAQSIELTGDDKEYEKYKEVPIMFCEKPADEDKPATLTGNLKLLSEAGFCGVDCFWKKAGFAVFGGYRGIEKRA